LFIFSGKEINSKNTFIYDRKRNGILFQITDIKKPNLADIIGMLLKKLSELLQHSLLENWKANENELCRCLVERKFSETPFMENEKESENEESVFSIF
jgi:hypothetical protein